MYGGVLTRSAQAPVLRVYTQYLTNYDQQLRVLTELEKRQAFVAFNKAAKGKMSLANYLILPVQRLPRYEMLLEVRLRFVPFTAEYFSTDPAKIYQRGARR